MANMDCNKDEASRAKSIAEAKLELKDFAGAKKFALKAQNLYAGLNGISQMLTTLDVYVSSEKKINGQVDWYGVLGVSPTADDETIKKQYRKLALMLHPDKNNSAGADGAFKLISEAWGLLSDKDKRSAYNLITGCNNPSRPSPSMVYPSGPCTRPGGPSGSSKESPIIKYSKRKSSASKSQKKSENTAPVAPKSSPAPVAPKSSPAPVAPKSSPAPVAPKPSPAPANQTVESFWTFCCNCKIKYEYHILYRNATLLCLDCKMPFMATEIPRPVTKSKSPKPGPCVSVQKQQQPSPVDNNNYNNNNSNNNNSSAPPCANNARRKNVALGSKKRGTGKGSLNISTHAQKPEAGQTGPNISMQAQQGPRTAPTSVNNSAAGPSVVAKVAVSENKLKRPMSTELNAAMERCTKKRKMDGQNDGGHRKNNHSNGEIHEGQNGNSGTTGIKLEASAPQELTCLEARKALMGKARKEVLRKLDEPSPEINPEDYNYNATVTITTNNNKRNDNKAEKREMGPADKKQRDRKPEKLNGNSHKKATDDSSGEINNAVMMNVPDPDFYDFDKDRSEKSFADNEVWAAYDNDDGMPRFYVMIHKVISKRPFQLKISWLNSKTTTEFSPTLEWVESGFYKSCGEFRIGKHETCRFINAFSQRVKWSKGPRGAVLIYPQKGDVWAAYRNWSSDWGANTPDDVIHKYDMVMVVEGYDEEKGLMSVAPLVKVVGYRTVFRPDIRKDAVVEIRREEMFRLSHRVPHHALTTHEAPSVPDGCVEIDPAATPLELLGMAEGTK